MMNKSILEVVHDGAKDLHKAGLLNDVTMKEFDALCLPPVKILTAKQIQKIREREHVSQPVFAAYLNTTKSTVSQWERGEKQPRGTSLKLLHVVMSHGLKALS